MAYLVKIFKNVTIKPGTWRNFSGTVGPYNSPIGVDENGEKIGKRYFSIDLTPEMAEELRNIELMAKNKVTGTEKLIRGANIRTFINKDGNPEYSLKIGLGAIPPQEIYEIKPQGKLALNLSNVGNLDHKKIDHADMTVTFSAYDTGSNSGIAAYLTTLYAHVIDDELAQEYADMPTIGAGYSGLPQNDDEVPF